MYGINKPVLPRPNAVLPPGFRFHPTDEELIIHYVKQKVSPSCINNPVISIIADVNIYKFNPWELPDKALFGEDEWFFFSPRDKKYPNGKRPNRAAASGYWKATGTDKPIISSFGSQCLGMKKALVFYRGRPPKGIKTDWMMMEYRLIDDYSLSPRPKESMRLDDWVLCRVRQKSNVPQQIGRVRTWGSSSSCSPPLDRGYLQGQEMSITEQNNNNINNNTLNILQEYNKYHELAAAADQYQMAAAMEIEEVDEKGQTILMDYFQESSPEYSFSPLTSTSSSQTTIDSNVRDVLKSIERVLSVGALDEFLLPMPPSLQIQPEEKRFNEACNSTTSSRSCSVNGNEPIFHISSPDPSASYQQPFSEF